MKKDTSTLYDAITNDRVISESIETFLIKEADLGPTVTISMIVELLKIIQNRLSIGQEITMEKTGTVLTSDNFCEYLSANYSSYIKEEVCK
ncbi:MAG: hypothetical protein Q4F21_00395 [Lachnospiraceae bacterium]|nr:hypothetical protein [Lachnospiraceae bacterium]